MLVGAYSSIFIAPGILANLREREPAMQALAKRVASRGNTSEANTGAATKISRRTQAKRKGRK
jgi:preprotein translocase subunit SecF